MASDLGMKRKELYGGMCEPSKDYDNELVYPQLSLEGRQAEAAGLKADFGDEMTITLKVRVSRVGGQSSPQETPGITLDVLSIDTGKKTSNGRGLAGAYQAAVDGQ